MKTLLVIILLLLSCTAVPARECLTAPAYQYSDRYELRRLEMDRRMREQEWLIRQQQIEQENYYRWQMQQEYNRRNAEILRRVK